LFHFAETTPKQIPNIGDGTMPALRKDVGHIMISYCWGDKENVLRVIHTHIGVS